MSHPVAEKLLQGDLRALARAITIVENQDPGYLELLQSIYSHTGRAHCIGITGAPGAGKSTLVDQFMTDLRKRGLTVAVAAVDPTSPFSGGAILGDRVRMSRHFTDPGVYIRSMGTRGSLGGLARSTKDTVRLLDAFGFDVILVETVGVGQSELDIMKISDTTLLVLNPNAGDVVQVFKAGIMEIADIFLINKADLPGAGKLQGQINSLLDLIKKDRDWRPPIVRTSATRQEGFDDVWKRISEHRTYLEEKGRAESRRKDQLKTEVQDIIKAALALRIEQNLEQRADWEEAVSTSDGDPYRLAEKFLDEFLPENPVKGGVNE